MINCVIIDDEPKNNRLLQNMLGVLCPDVNVLAVETNPKAGVEIIRELQPQLVFLDVEMPYLNGFGVLKQLEPIGFEVIFVTAFSHYAVNAFEHQATGYITKPVNAEKLQAAVNAAIKRIEEKTINRNLFSLLAQNNRQDVPDKIPLSTTGGLLFVKLTDIMFCESSGNYTHFFLCDEKKIVVSRQLGEYEKLLPENNFIRIHDKYIINLSYIREYIKGSGGEVVLENGRQLPVATRRKEEFLSRFEKWIRRKG
ncbi:MAG TPA: LytTR family DNA-binding domain-containing protein [Chitinophagaceae bacterium]|jgi:two-component system LytT family response regulator|nr:LytTR family DNA-binding domain-containing protein [Chitinophagaceae bacterium]HMU59551.1 LytTR family DNA-binding domain-containing protein [Chitinophagaceae bacterium]